ncbi:MAG: DNA polymerase domain-containing protein [Candidatus Helarchaeota archaeon]
MKDTWILDVNVIANDIVVWLKNGDKVIKKRYNYKPSFYIAIKDACFSDLIRALEGHPYIDEVKLEKKYVDIRDHIKSPALKITVDKLQNFNRVKRDLANLKNTVLYNADIPHSRMWLYLNDLFPTAKVHVNNSHPPVLVDGESRASLDYNMPDFKSIELDIKVKNRHIRPRIDDKLGTVIIKFEDEKIIVDHDCEAELLLKMCRIINDIDPDIIYTKNGDSFLFPYLIARGSYNRILQNMSISRENYPFEKGLIRLQGGGSYQSYGITYYRSPLQYFLYGRLHIDSAMGTRAFPWQGIEGIIEVARITMVPIQNVSRITIGQAMTSMQFYEAIKNDILIPLRKTNTSEKFKTGLKMVKSDKGGFIFTPQVGFFENVYELDFSSMYPTIMLTRNISPETILCSCKNSTHYVPDLGYNICGKRIGLIPRVLKLVLDKRLRYKRLARKYGKNSRYNARQAALKWILVTSFGYMGYKNARFGRIEAHESVTAFARKILIDTFHIAEEHGLKVLHGIVDCLWVQPENGVGTEEIKSFCQKVNNKTKIELDNKGKYEWIIFLPLKSDPTIATLNHYYGKLENDTIKVRGLQVRKHDSPKIVKDAQNEILDLFKNTHNWDEFNKAIPKARKILNKYITRIKTGKINIDDLLITSRLSKNITDYVMNTRQVSASLQLHNHGVNINAGEMVQYVITDANATNPLHRVVPAQLIKSGTKIKYDKYEYTKLLNTMLNDMLSFRKNGVIPSLS